MAQSPPKFNKRICFDNPLGQPTYHQGTGSRCAVLLRVLSSMCYSSIVFCIRSHRFERACRSSSCEIKSLIGSARQVNHLAKDALCSSAYMQLGVHYQEVFCRVTMKTCCLRERCQHLQNFELLLNFWRAGGTCLPEGSTK